MGSTNQHNMKIQQALQVIRHIVNLILTPENMAHAREFPESVRSKYIMVAIKIQKALIYANINEN